MSEETNEKKKAGVAVWEYQNSDEDFVRIIAVSLESLQAQVDAGTMTKDDIPRIIYGMEGAIELMKSCYNIYPKTSEFENKKPSDLKYLAEEDSLSE